MRVKGKRTIGSLAGGGTEGGREEGGGGGWGGKGEWEGPKETRTAS